MAIIAYDFITGIDFTGLGGGIAAAGDHNNLINLARPQIDKGLVVVSQDTALNTPDVPDAFTTTKWQQYIWVRRLFTGESTIPLLYMWNEDATFVATYQKWQRVTSDTTAVEALIAALDTRVDNVETSLTAAQADIVTSNNTAATALTTANAASATATTANNTANAAQTTADIAVTNAAAAQTTADTAKTASDAAVAAAAAATTASNTATVAVSDVVTFVSAAYALALGSLIATVAHGLTGVTPRNIRWILVCTTNDAAAGFLQGDQVPIESFYGEVGAYQYPAFAVKANSTSITLRLMNATPQTLSEVASVQNFHLIDIAKWKAQCYFSKY